MQLAARHFTSSPKQKNTNIITTSQNVNPIKKSFQDEEFVKNIILTTIKNWNPQKPGELDLKVWKSDVIRISHKKNNHEKSTGYIATNYNSSVGKFCKR
jgi:hypothetical protein